ncbi:FHA domain-containing protein [bacterium AH-315-K03]|nr:FHA domain-containing protein [bacterium AH-315-K03]
MYKLQFKNSPQNSFLLVGEQLCLGASKDNDVVLEGSGVDEYHARILISKNRIVLQGLAAACYVNDQPVEGECELNEKDELRFGQQCFVVLLSGGEEESNKVIIKDARKAVPKKSLAGWSIVSEHPKLRGRDFSLTRSAILGRGISCDFEVPFQSLSREHAKFKVDSDSLLVTDLGSFNGTFVDGKRVTEARLHGGETLTFAKLSFTVHSPQRPIELESEGGDNQTLVRPVLGKVLLFRRKVVEEDVVTEESVVTEVFLNVQTDSAQSVVSAPMIGKKSDYFRWYTIVGAGVIVASVCWLWLF